MLVKCASVEMYWMLTLWWLCEPLPNEKPTLPLAPCNSNGVRGIDDEFPISSQTGFSSREYEVLAHTLLFLVQWLRTRREFSSHFLWIGFSEQGKKVSYHLVLGTASTTLQTQHAANEVNNILSVQFEGIRTFSVGWVNRKFTSFWKREQN